MYTEGHQGSQWIADTALSYFGQTNSTYVMTYSFVVTHYTAATPFAALHLLFRPNPINWNSNMIFEKVPYKNISINKRCVEFQKQFGKVPYQLLVMCSEFREFGKQIYKLLSDQVLL